MCDDGISREQYERMRIAYGALHAAAREVLAGCGSPPEGSQAATAVAALRAALLPDPARFAIAAVPGYRILLQGRPHSPGGIQTGSTTPS